MICQAITKSGRRCKNSARSGSAYCHLHSNYQPNDPSGNSSESNGSNPETSVTVSDKLAATSDQEHVAPTASPRTPEKPPAKQPELDPVMHQQPATEPIAPAADDPFRLLAEAMTAAANEVGLQADARQSSPSGTQPQSVVPGSPKKQSPKKQSPKKHGGAAAQPVQDTNPAKSSTEPKDPFQTVADALAAAAREIEEDEHSSPNIHSQPATDRGMLAQAAYSTSYGLGYSVMLPVVFACGLLPLDNAVGKGLKDGAVAAKSKVEEIRPRKPRP
jgi:hypothetical protein